MNDITKQPYAEWLESALREMVDLKPQTIGIVTIMPDGTTATQYYSADNRDRAVMIESIMIDYMEALIIANADHIKEIILGEDDE